MPPFCPEFLTTCLALWTPVLVFIFCCLKKILLLRPFAYEYLSNNSLKNQSLKEEENLVAHVFEMFYTEDFPFSLWTNVTEVWQLSHKHPCTFHHDHCHHMLFEFWVRHLNSESENKKYLNPLSSSTVGLA